MCVAMPGTVLSVTGHRARVDFHGNAVDAEAGLVSVRPGDRVLVHAGCIIQTMSPETAEETEELYRLIEGL
ncbi:MAG: HypC/HybG/HupF family hydrogenase formation chaperone [Lachnospiraceae bacterium]|nr:HypC/HybG/HupF family hydrogenase formation chaperone [Lachnospiraceae bacterium]